jgi:aspartyl-tRNA(Asn)/glutamyl-tRNA(Gln) amidotransferase subunit B
LPAFNAEVARLATIAGLALGCTIQNRSVFSRKNYFYPDSPKGYQITQFDLPICLDGALDIDMGGQTTHVRIRRIHIEEDAGKSNHGIGNESIVDLNRAGTPLIEIVSDPDLHSGAEAAEYLKKLREILMFVGVNDGNLEQGSFRCDANVSVRKRGTETLGTRVELKNINSFRFVGEAIDGEARRQIHLLERGDRIRQQTRGYNAEKKESYVLRDKESESDYRYFPEPDLLPLVLNAAYITEIRDHLPQLPADKRREWVDSLGLTPYAAGVLSGHPRIAKFFDDTRALYTDALKLSNFVQSEVLRDVTTTGLEAKFPVTPFQVAEILRLVDAGTISGKQAKELYAAVMNTDRAPGDVVHERGMAVIGDESAIEAIAKSVLEANQRQVAAYRAGKTALLGYFVGQMMKQTKGSADPAVVNAVLARLLGG